jgi:fido (protein-threonine AMPylation protein)
VARQRRHTEPLETLHGLLTEYAQIDRLLLDGEYKGLAWIFERAQNAPGATPTDEDVLELHRVAFGSIFAWAGTPRKKDVGPAGVVYVHYWDVPSELRKAADDLQT